MNLSVLTPTYAYGRFLSDAVASVSAQRNDGEAAQHVIVDGGSVDETLEVLAAAPPNVVWRSEPDHGQSDALNKALTLAKGDWIAWLNADEFYLPGAFETLAACAAEHPDVAMFYGDAVFVDVTGRALRLVAQHSFSRRVLRWNRCNISSCAMVVRRDVIPKRGWDVELKATMDWDLYLEIERAGSRIVYVPCPLACFRVHSEQVTAEPLPPDHPDFPRLRARHRRPSGTIGVIANRAGELEHRGLKLVQGGYLRELRTRRHRGADLRWFVSPSAAANAASVVAAGSAREWDGAALLARANDVCRPG